MHFIFPSLCHSREGGNPDHPNLKNIKIYCILLITKRKCLFIIIILNPGIQKFMSNMTGFPRRRE